MSSIGPKPVPGPSHPGDEPAPFPDPRPQQPFDRPQNDVPERPTPAPGPDVPPMQPDPGGGGLVR